MHHTGMTVGGFIQPSVARSLIELQSNVEKGLCQRFLWFCPKATFVKFDQLQQIDASFSTRPSDLSRRRRIAAITLPVESAKAGPLVLT